MSVVFSSGNGFALYGGVKLPNIESVWTEELKQTYPWAFVTPFGKSAGVPGIWRVDFYSAEVVKNGEELDITTNGRYSAFMTATPTKELYDVAESEGVTIEELIDAAFGLSFTGWSKGTFGTLEGETGPGGFVSIPDGVTWSSKDILNTDGSTYLAASDPIPLDGMEVIEWDGDTTGLDVVNETHYRVSDYFSKPSEAVGVGNNTYTGELFTFNGVGTEDSNYAWTSPAGSTSVCGVKDSGVYFYSYEVESKPIYASLFAYKEAVGGVESVTIEPSEVTVNPGAVIQFSAIVSGTGEYSQDVTWELGFGEQYGTPAITQTGTVSIPADMLPCKVFVVARSAQNETVSGLSTINVEEDKTYSVKSSTMTAIANAIRKLKGSTDQYKPTEMPAAITPNVVIGIDYSTWDSGAFSETLDNGTTLKYAVTLEDGKPTQVTAPDGTVTAVDWGDS